MTSSADWAGFESLLCVRPDNLGDVLMTTPAIRALKQSNGRRRITMLTSRAGASIAAHVPEIDDIEIFDPPWYRHEQAGDRNAVTAAIERLARRKFDAAIIFTVFSQNPLPSAMLCYQAGVPRIAGYCRENPYGLITDWIPDKEPLYGVRHEVQRQLDLATALGARPRQSALSLRVPSGLHDQVLQVLCNAGVDVDAPWLLLHPGASEERRRYPPQKFSLAARAIRQRMGMQVVLTGSAAEKPLADSIAGDAGAGVFPVAGRFEIPAFITLVSMAPVMISNNTGPAHIAAAVQTPVVVLYALTNPQHAPWQVAHRVLPFDVPPAGRSRNVIVRYAGDRCFSGTTGMAGVEDIVDAVRELVDSTGTCAAETGLVTTSCGFGPNRERKTPAPGL
ncbi:MAG TPA: glycosyltransferase family 9 protein [Gammaproteobacteria bacterium]